MFTNRPPSPPAPVEDIAFPVIALLVPLGLSLVMALVLHSPLALMMGVLGPVMVLAGWFQQKKSHTKTSQRRAEEFQQSLADFQAELESARDAQRTTARTALPQVLNWMADPLWRRESHPSTLVRVGEGLWSAPAGHPLEGTGAILGMPAGVDSTMGLALIGDSSAVGVWRNLVVQWLIASGPAGLDPMPTCSQDPTESDFSGVSRLVWVTDISQVPAECATVVVYQGESSITITHSAHPTRVVRPDRLSFAEALWAVEKLSGAEDHSAEPTGAQLKANSREEFRAELSVSGPRIDLVREGPHAVVWGATGSGKSVTVCSLVVSLAQRYSPRDFVCVLIDFKGGAGLRPLLSLPHTLGMVSDLDAGRSDRALSGLVAEMEKRERIMAEHQVADLAHLEDSVWCPRLVVVVDEVAWLCHNSPRWAETLCDLAQRGRSLGIHLILSTQRISGVLPRALMANVSLRVCGRISEESEVLEWIPDAHATLTSALRRVAPGRVLVAGALSTPAWHPVSAADPSGLIGAAEPSRWRVWAEELPEQISVEQISVEQMSSKQISPDQGVWALADVPQSQSHEPIYESPLDRGSLAIVGDHASGRTSTAFALAAVSGGGYLAPANPAELWQCLRELHGTRATLVLDDVDALLHRVGAEAEACLLDALEAFDGVLVLTLSPRHRLARSVARLAPGRLVLALASPDDRSAWEGADQVNPGRGRWDGRDIQVVFPSPIPPQWSPVEPTAAHQPPIVITEQPAQWAQTTTAFVGGLEDVQRQWERLARELPHTEVVVDGLGSRDVRHATLGRITLPPLDPAPGWCWVWRGGAAYLASSVGRGRS